MLRTLALALALAAPSVAAAEQFPESPLGQEVRSHDGTVLGRVTAVERDASGRIVAVEIPGLEPGDAPDPGELIVENEDEVLIRVRDSGADREASAGGEAHRLR